jgi:flavin-dependent dehydrogenase
MTENQSYDVVVMGGGLAGLTLALQLRQKFADMSILVLERRAHPVPEAAHKVGESSVEIGAHYFDQVLALKPHLDSAQIKKFGFRFFFNDKSDDLSKVTELGASKVLMTPSYQIDRGIFENYLAVTALERGIDFIDQAMVKSFDLSENGSEHRIEFETKSSEQTSERKQVEATWLVDACGRAGLIKRKLDLSQANEHHANAIWFRIEDRIDVNEWSNDQTWIDRCTPPDRWRSTNHLCGEGYWTWLIPLASGSHSVGIVADAKIHPIETINTFEKAMLWFKTHQPQLYKDLDGKRDKLQDFAFFKKFSYGCKKVYSGAQRWALTGEAGLFLDPFYSPGSDFIAIGNTFITEMIAQDRNKRTVELYSMIYEQVYFSLYDNMLTLYQDQYKLFGDSEVMPVKVIWDYTYYWGVMCQLFFQNRLTDLMTMGRMQTTLASVQGLNKDMQLFLRSWGEVSRKSNPAQMLDQASLPWFAELNRGLKDTLTPAQFDERMRANLVQLNQLAEQIVDKALTAYPQLNATAIRTRIMEQRSSTAEPQQVAMSEAMLFG